MILAEKNRTDRVSARYKRLLQESEIPHECAYAWRREINRGGFRAVDFLMDAIVDQGKCVGCASCITICPVDVFDYIDEKPADTREQACVQCVLCADACPVLRPVDQDLPEFLNFRDPVFDEGYGRYSYGVYARATDKGILERGQDGGMVSAVLIHGLEQGTLNGAVLGDVTSENNQIGVHRLATDRDSVLACGGSRYTYSPNTIALQEAVRRDIRPLAVVGVPCQVDGIRLQQNSGINLDLPKWYRKNVSLVIGLFCSEAFTHESIEKLGEMIEVDTSLIENINIKGKVVVRLNTGEVVTASLKKYRDFARSACLYCLDYGAENADIAAGGIGLDGWTYTLVRTERGHEAFRAALDDGWIETCPLETEPRGEFLMQKLSADKKKNRPLPAKMPSLDERIALEYLDPKTFYTKGPGAPKSNDS